MNNTQNNFVDITVDLSNHGIWNSVLLFRGVQACKQRAVVNTSRLIGIPLGSRVGEMVMYVIGLWLKIIITVLVDSSCNSLASDEGGYLTKFYSLFGSQKQLVWAVVYYCPSLFVKLKPREESSMSIQNKKSNQSKFTKNKSNLKLVSLIFAGLTLTSCREEPDRTTISGRAKYDARFIKHDVHTDYLSCYPLDPREKATCLEQVANKHLKQKFDRDYETYKKYFQRESEKLGFKYFLNNKGLACESVKHAPPLVDPKEEIYFVKCSSGESYHMQFDYYNKQWNLRG